jgi:hypothetical protein
MPMDGEKVNCNVKNKFALLDCGAEKDEDAGR